MISFEDFSRFLDHLEATNIAIDELNFIFHEKLKTDFIDGNVFLDNELEGFAILFLANAMSHEYTYFIHSYIYDYIYDNGKVKTEDKDYYFDNHRDFYDFLCKEFVDN